MLSSFERMVAFRYLRARREEGLISVIALFSLIGIALGVATLIVVLAVMNGVRGELIESIIGLEGHVSVYDNGLILLPFEDAQVYFKLKDNGGNAVSSIEIMGDNPDQSLDIARRVGDIVGPGFRIYDWKTSNNNIFQAVIVQRNVMFLILM